MIKEKIGVVKSINLQQIYGMMQKTIAHSGVVTSIKGKQLEVTILSQSACVSCQVKGACSVSDVAEKIVEVDMPPSRQLAVGDHVTVVMDRSGGLRAVMLGYFYPFILMILVLFTMHALTGNEGLAGLSAIGSLVPYYLLLHVFNHRIKSKFQFRIKE